MGPYYDLMDSVYLEVDGEFARKWTGFYDDFVDEVVPALAIVLHNGVRYQLRHENFPEAGRREALMDLAWGAMPFVEVASDHVPGAHGMPTYEQVRDYVLAGWELCCQRYADRAGVDLQSIERLEGNRWRTRYADGITFEVDLTKQTVSEV